VVQGYTRLVKTAISIPDAAFRRAEQHAAKLRLSRSEFFTRAAERWADELDREDLTDAINAALEAADRDHEDGVAAFHRAARRTFLADDDG
jgi:hypothetical protein